MIPERAQYAPDRKAACLRQQAEIDKHFNKKINEELGSNGEGEAQPGSAVLLDNPRTGGLLMVWRLAPARRAGHSSILGGMHSATEVRHRRDTAHLVAVAAERQAAYEALKGVAGDNFLPAEVEFVYAPLRGEFDAGRGLDAVRGAIEAASRVSPGR